MERSFFELRELVTDPWIATKETESTGRSDFSRLGSLQAPTDTDHPEEPLEALSWEKDNLNA